MDLSVNSSLRLSKKKCAHLRFFSLFPLKSSISPLEIPFFPDIWSILQREIRIWTLDHGSFHRMKCMSSESRGFEKFAEILEKKIRKQIESELLKKASQGQNPSESPSAANSSHINLGKDSNTYSETWARLFTQVNPVHFSNPTLVKRYPSQNRPTRPRPAHVMNPEQVKAFEFLNFNGAGLTLNFSKREAQASFRKLALKLHPDQGGNAESFQQLIAARKALMNLL